MNGNANRPPANATIASQILFTQRSKTKSESGPLVKKYKCIPEDAFSVI